jgi:hypothetical protein
MSKHKCSNRDCKCIICHGTIDILAEQNTIFQTVIDSLNSEMVQLRKDLRQEILKNITKKK